jgi:general secretion pathway protein N
MENYANIAARPIFRPTRRPPEPVRAEPPPPPPTPVVVAPPPPPPSPLPPMTLVGVVIDPAGRTALLQAPNQPTTLSVRAGESVEGWLLAEVRPDGVLFRRGAQEQELTFPAQQAQSTPGGGGGHSMLVGAPGGPGQSGFVAPPPKAPIAPPPSAAENRKKR